MNIKEIGMKIEKIDSINISVALLAENQLVIKLLSKFLRISYNLKKLSLQALNPLHICRESNNYDHDESIFYSKKGKLL
jgi:hypothetical protein